MAFYHSSGTAQGRDLGSRGKIDETSSEKNCWHASIVQGRVIPVDGADRRMFKLSLNVANVGGPFFYQ